MKEEAFRESLKRWVRRDFPSYKEAAHSVGLHPQQISDSLRGVIPIPTKLAQHYGYDIQKVRVYLKADSNG